MRKVTMFTTMITLLTIGLFAQASADAFAPAYVAAGGGYNSATSSKSYGWFAYAKKTSFTNGSFPVYSYTEFKTYQIPETKKLAADYTTGFLFPFYSKPVGPFHVNLAVDGNVGVTQTAENIGYTIGAKVVAQINTAKTGNWSLVLSADPNRSSVSGIRASQASVGVAYAFKGL